MKLIAHHATALAHRELQAELLQEKNESLRMKLETSIAEANSLSSLKEILDSSLKKSKTSSSVTDFPHMFL